GAVVVSGLARGIDGIAHRATLDSGGTTIAVLGSGCDVPYPHDHETLLREVAETGLVLTEFLPGEPPRRGHFPRRNRLIAALSLGVVVVEAGVRSGSLITVGHALELGREVFAVPGPVTRNTSAGTNALVRDGATVVLGVEDVIEGLRRAGANVGEPVARTAAVRRESATATTQTAPHDMGEFPTRVLAALSTEPRSAEAIAGESSLDPGTTLSALLELELGGFARQLPGFRFVRA
ncbi:MAG TPA: DNA-processing protein DprA, partial [Longimicrobiales bacterium]|nr:DNA-processing protein DprA [Longimicrobiales bacterium]